MQVSEELVGGEPTAVTGAGKLLVRISRRESTVVVEVAGSVLTAGLAALRHLLADLIEGQGNLFIVVELGDDGLVDPVLLAALRDARASSPNCQLTVVPAHPPKLLSPS